MEITWQKDKSNTEGLHEHEKYYRNFLSRHQVQHLPRTSSRQWVYVRLTPAVTYWWCKGRASFLLESNSLNLRIIHKDSHKKLLHLTKWVEARVPACGRTIGEWCHARGWVCREQQTKLSGLMSSNYSYAIMCSRKCWELELDMCVCVSGAWFVILFCCSWEGLLFF